MRALVISTVIGALALSGCQSMNTGTNSGATGSSGGFRDYQKTAIGAGLGAIAGYGLSRAGANSSAQNNRAAAIGAILGAAGGLYLDKKEQKLRQQMAGTGVDVNRNPDGSVGLVMPGNITFDTNSYNIKSNFYSTLNKVSQTLTEDNKSAILVTGYTDNTGNDSINIPLSKNRANAVAQYLISQGVPSSRVNSEGHGASNPIASNSTASGREQNRRVEISIYEVK
ncbi:OmpA family protein [Acinetobacter sp. ANC 4641]|uniref:OmpA family protein n=1 Tax=Acinetobacter sp. ANC 4641 TaxID=2529847 RepID=UPI00103A1B54|nr:OmpA family protein [Acinetobacter sp. ANC 4641]TCB13087.1 hypothetical protein E0H78_00285 [Acinetobacter sp. ANC 4641]